MNLKLSSAGIVENVSLLRSSGSKILDDASIEYAKNITFEPIKNSNEVYPARVITLPFNYVRPDRFKDFRKTCEDLLVETDWIKSAHSDAWNDEKYKRNFAVQEFLHLYKYTFDKNEKEQIEHSLAQKIDTAIDKCRQAPASRAQDIYRNILENEPYYDKGWTKEEALQNLDKIDGMIRKINNHEYDKK